MKRLTLIVLTLCMAGSLCHAQKNIFLGLNGSVGVPCFWENNTHNNPTLVLKAHGIGGLLEFGLDFAYPVSQNFAIGLYVSGGPGLGGCAYDLMSAHNRGDVQTYRSMFYGGELRAGILMLAGDVNRRPFIIGIAPCSGIIAFGAVKERPDGLSYAISGLPLDVRFGAVVTDHLYVTGNLNVALFSGGEGAPIGIISPSITVGYHFGSKFRTKK